MSSSFKEKDSYSSMPHLLNSTTTICRRQSIFPDTTLDESFAAFQERERKRRQAAKRDSSGVSREQTNPQLHLVTVVILIVVSLTLVVAISFYLRFLR